MGSDGLVGIALIAHLGVWANVPPESPGGIRSLSQEEKIAHLERHQPILNVRQKLIAVFRPREGESDVFICPWTGERLSYPNCALETILSEDEIELLQEWEDDPILGILEEGWNSAIALFREQLIQL